MSTKAAPSYLLVDASVVPVGVWGAAWGPVHVTIIADRMTSRMTHNDAWVCHPCSSLLLLLLCEGHVSWVGPGAMRATGPGLWLLGPGTVRPTRPLLLLLVEALPAVLLLLHAATLVASTAVAVMPSLVVVVAIQVMLVVVLMRWELVCDVKPRSHAKELHDGDNTCCYFLQYWAYPIADHRSEGQQHWCNEELGVVRHPGDE